MNREDNSAQPCPRYFHPRQQQPEQKRSCNVEQDCDHMVAGGGGAEERPLHPERGVGEREVVGAIGIKPEFCEALKRSRLHDGILREELIVVPEPVPVIRGRINPQSCQNDDGRLHKERAAAVCPVGWVSALTLERIGFKG